MKAINQKCKQCRQPMNPVEAMLSATHGVCGKCTRLNHERATGQRTTRRRAQD